MIVNREGHVLAIERADTADAWQLPQGGLDTSEEPLAAAYREAAEETGVRKRDLELVKPCSELLVYELPPPARTEKTGRGQVLYWFLFTYRGTKELADFAPTREIQSRRWMPFSQVIAKAAPFRKPMYDRLAKEFAEYLA